MRCNPINAIVFRLITPFRGIFYFCNAAKSLYQIILGTIRTKIRNFLFSKRKFFQLFSTTESCSLKRDKTLNYKNNNITKQWRLSQVFFKDFERFFGTSILRSTSIAASCQNAYLFWKTGLTFSFAFLTKQKKNALYH